MADRTPEEIKFDESLKLLMTAQFAGMDPVAQAQLAKTASQIQMEYDDARAKADDKGLSAEKRKQYKEIAESIAKSLPGITKGALSAADAFMKGDNISGAAAIMDVCASIIPLFSLAGPEGAAVGAIVGAIFSCVGQILAFFAPKQPSLGEQIKKMFENIEAEKELSNLAGVHSAINIYTAELDDTREEIRKILAIPLTTEREAEKFRTDVEALKIGVVDTQGQVNAAAFETWKVGGWLTRKENQEKDRWPEVLGAWCQEYVHLMTANMRVSCLANPKEIDRLQDLVAKGNKESPLDEETKGKVRDSIVNGLKPILKFIAKKFRSWNTEALRIVREATPAARERGLYVHMAPWDNYGNVLYVAAARAGELKWEYKKNTGWLRNFSINLPKEQFSSLTPRYELLACETSAISRHSLDSATGALSDGRQLMVAGTGYPNLTGGGKRTFEKCVGAWGLPDWENPNRTRIFTAHDAGTWAYVNIHVVEADNSVKRVNWEPRPDRGLSHIRAVVRDIKNSLPDDPDAAALPPHGLYELIYGGYSGKPKIWVEFDNAWGDVPSPWEQYNGIEVDPYCLWVFGPKGLACATHASLVRCKKGEIGKPNWITYNTGWKDGFNVTALSACADGTLILSSKQQDSNCWTPNYDINLKERRIGLKPWDRRGGWGTQVQKMAIPCWSLLDSLRANLQADKDSRGVGA